MSTTNYLKKYLFENRYSFHSNQQYDKRSLRAVNRDLHPSTPTEDIITSFSDLGHQVTHVHGIKRFAYKSPFPFFFVDQKKKNHQQFGFFTKCCINTT